MEYDLVVEASICELASLAIHRAGIMNRTGNTDIFQDTLLGEAKPARRVISSILHTNRQ